MANKIPREPTQSGKCVGKSTGESMASVKKAADDENHDSEIAAAYSCGDMGLLGGPFKTPRESQRCPPIVNRVTRGEKA